MIISGCQKLSRTSRSCGEQQSRAAKDAGQERVFKDLVLPMILPGLTMNFILYEKDCGLAIARLCIVVSTRNEVIALNSNKRHSQK